jgi:hypothetical protein
MKANIITFISLRANGESQIIYDEEANRVLYSVRDLAETPEDAYINRDIPSACEVIDDVVKHILELSRTFEINFIDISAYTFIGKWEEENNTECPKDIKSEFQDMCAYELLQYYKEHYKNK